LPCLYRERVIYNIKLDEIKRQPKWNTVYKMKVIYPLSEAQYLKRYTKMWKTKPPKPPQKSRAVKVREQCLQLKIDP
jgi:hypothetical protein